MSEQYSQEFVTIAVKEVSLELQSCLTDPAPDPLSLLIKKQAAKIVWESLSAVPLRQRRAIVLRWEGLTFSSIGRELGISEQGAWLLYQRACIRFRRELKSRQVKRTSDLL